MTQNYLKFDPFFSPKYAKLKEKGFIKTDADAGSNSKNAKLKPNITGSPFSQSHIIHKFSLAKSLMMTRAQLNPLSLPPIDAVAMNIDLSVKGYQNKSLMETLSHQGQAASPDINNEYKFKAINPRGFIIKTKVTRPNLKNPASPFSSQPGKLMSPIPNKEINVKAKGDYSEDQVKDSKNYGGSLYKTKVKELTTDNKPKSVFNAAERIQNSGTNPSAKSELKSNTIKTKKGVPLQFSNNLDKKPANLSNKTITVSLPNMNTEEDTIIREDLFFSLGKPSQDQDKTYGNDTTFLNQGLLSLHKKKPHAPTSLNKMISFEMKVESGKKIYNIQSSEYDKGFALEEVQTENYDWDLVDICIGEGTWGKVFKAFDKSKGMTYALKIISFSDQSDPRFHSGIEEALLHKRVCEIESNKYVKLYDAYIKTEETGQKEKQLILVLELCECSLANIIDIRKENSMSWDEESFMKIVKDLLEACFELFKNNIVHRDIKPHNILYSLSEKRYKLADFGEGKIISISDSDYKNGKLHPFRNTIRGSPCFMSLELYQSYETHELTCIHNPFASDLFSLGATLLAAIILEKKINAQERINKLENLDKSLKSTQIISKLLLTDPMKRIENCKSVYEELISMVDSKTSSVGSMIEIQELNQKQPTSDIETAMKNIKIAEAYVKLFNFSKAKELLNNVISQFNGESLSPEHKFVVSDAYKNLGKLQVDIYESEGALSNLLKALEMRSSIMEESNPYIGELNNEIGIAYMRMDDLENAEKYYQKAVNISKSMTGAGTMHFSDSLHNLASLFLLQKKHEKALQIFHKSLEVVDSMSQSSGNLNNTAKADTLNNIGALYLELGNSDEAEKYLRESLILSERSFGSNHPSLASIIYNIGQLRLSKGLYDAETISLYEKALKLWTAAYGENYRKNIDIYNNMSLYYQKNENSSMAISCLKKAVDISNSAENFGKIKDKDQIELNLGNLLLITPGEQEKGLSLILDSLDKFSGDTSISEALAVTYSNLGTYYVEKDKLLDAEKYYQLAVENYKKLKGSDHFEEISKIEIILKGIRNAEPKLAWKNE